jgi:hypothetical protein
MKISITFAKLFPYYDCLGAMEISNASSSGANANFMPSFECKICY